MEAIVANVQEPIKFTPTYTNLEPNNKSICITLELLL